MPYIITVIIELVHKYTKNKLDTLQRQTVNSMPLPERCNGTFLNTQFLTIFGHVVTFHLLTSESSQYIFVPD